MRVAPSSRDEENNRKQRHFHVFTFIAIRRKERRKKRKKKTVHTTTGVTHPFNIIMSLSRISLKFLCGDSKAKCQNRKFTVVCRFYFRNLLARGSRWHCLIRWHSFAKWRENECNSILFKSINGSFYDIFIIFGNNTKSFVNNIYASNRMHWTSLAPPPSWKWRRRK